MRANAEDIFHVPEILPLYTDHAFWTLLAFEVPSKLQANIVERCEHETIGLGVSVTKPGP